MGVFEMIGNIVGGLFDYKGTLDVNKANIEIANRNDQLQKEFAQSGIRWKVADAKAAGVHPLAALGAQTISYNPQMVAQEKPNIGPYMKSIGQNIDRALQVRGDAHDKFLQSRLMEHQVRKAAAEADIMEYEAVKGWNDLWSAPATPTDAEKHGLGDGVVDSDLVKYNQANVTRMGAPGLEPGLNPLEKVHVDKDGWVYLLPGASAEEALENADVDRKRYNLGKYGDVARGWMDYARNYRSDAKDPYKAPVNKKYRDGLRQWRAYINRVQAPAPGYEYRYSRGWGQWRHVKIGPEGSKLFN